MTISPVSAVLLVHWAHCWELGLLEQMVALLKVPTNLIETDVLMGNDLWESLAWAEVHDGILVLDVV